MKSEVQSENTMQKELDVAMALALIRNLYMKGMISCEILSCVDEKAQKILDTKEKI